ncbi:MAG: nicotinamide mononucleotide transporter [Sphingomonadales bacterium]|nr:nicotinamide mononucleotide transporter [Sphingomonadales bacterium]
MTALEIAANAVTTVSIGLAARNSIHTWWTGIAGAVLFAALFRSNQLYADVLLQAFFIATSVIGWVRWTGHGSGIALPVTRSGPGLLAAAIIAGTAATFTYGAILHRFTDAYAPFWDSLVLAFSVIAQLLLLNRKRETWHFWLLVNTVAVPLYCSRGLWLTGLLYAAYWVNAAIALRVWRRLSL